MPAAFPENPYTFDNSHLALPALIALMAIFLPVLERAPRAAGFPSALSGINAPVVGLLAAALYQPAWTSAVSTVPDFCIALGAFGLLTRVGARAWMVVGLGAAAGALLRLLG